MNLLRFGKRGALLLLVGGLAAAAYYGGAAVEAGSASVPVDTSRWDYRNWTVYEGDDGKNRYSVLDQINRSTVEQLEVAWTYRSGDARQDPPSTIECNPIVVDGVLYATSPKLKAFALDAATGEEQWRFDPFEGADASGVNRGVAYWESEDGTDKRILYAAGPRLYALDAETGEPVEGFGEGGSLDLKKGLDRDIGEEAYVSASSPGIVYNDLLILGSWVSEGPSNAAPGHVRAYDIKTGERAWIFHTIPHPGEVGYKTWPKDAWKHKGGANDWSGMSIDRERGWVFLSTGSAAYDFWGGDRKGKNLFANSVVALDAATGAYIWHYQIVHHDLLDRDLPSSPNLVTVTHDGEQQEAVAQITKTGHVFLLDRETGEPLFPVEERPVPASDLEGEAAWPTQPVPVKPEPFARQRFTEDLITDRSPEAHAYAKKRYQAVRSGGPFLPPSTDGTIVFPGFNGGGEWSGAAFDPASGLLYVNAQELPWILTMIKPGSGEEDVLSMSAGELAYRVNCAGCHGLDRKGQPPTYPSLVAVPEQYAKSETKEIIQNGRGQMPAFPGLSQEEVKALVAYLHGEEEAAEGEAARADVNYPYPYVHTGWKKFKDPAGYPAVKPPWGTLSAIDLDEGNILWQVPLGEHPELTRQGLPPTGTENFGGPLVTEGGLVFIGATKDEKFRAFDKKTGEVLWETSLPAGGYATPATYAVDGRQYVVIAAGGGGKIGTRAGDAYVAFALPSKATD